MLMQTIAEVLKKIEDYSISNRAAFEALVKKNLAMQQTDKTKKQQKRIPQITTRLEQIDKVLNKLYEDNALGTIPQDRYEQMSQKYSEEYYALKTELAAYTRQHPDQCRQTDADPETGCMEFEIAKGRFSFRLTAPYNEERREAARRSARENKATDRLK